MSGTSNKPAGISGVIVASILAAFLPPYMASSLNVALPTIGREFSMPAVGLSWLITSYLLAIAVFIMPFGKIGDQYGRRRLFLWGAAVYTMATTISGCMPSASALLIMRVFQGVGAAMIFSTGTALLVSVIPPSKRGSMLGLNVAATYIGLAAGPSIGGFLTQQFGWRSIFFTGAPLGLIIVFVVMLRVPKDHTTPSRSPFDISGSVLYGAALAGLMIGLPDLMSPKGAMFTALGAGLAVVFVIVESRVAVPLVHLDLFRRNTVFAFSSLAALLNYSATHGAGFLLSLYLQYVKGMPPRNAGLVMIFWPLVMAVFSPLAGKLSDRVETRIVASAGMGLTAVALFCFCGIGPATPVYRIVIGLVALGTGIAFFSSPNASAIMGAVDKRDYGMATSMVGTARLIGQMLSMSIVAFVMNAYVGNSAVTTRVQPAFLTSARISFAVFGTLCLLGLFASLNRGRVREKPGKMEAAPLDAPVSG